MNLAETAKKTGIAADVLVRMRARDTRTLKSGPPFHKQMGPNGEPVYVYNQLEVKRWMKFRRCHCTAGDAAIILGVHREDILDIHGVTGFDIRRKGFKGRLIVDNSRNIYMWLPQTARRGKKNG